MKRKKPYLLAGLVLLLFLLCTACGNAEGQIAPQDDPNEGLGGGFNEDTVNDFSSFEGIWLGEANNEYDYIEFDADGNWQLYLTGDVVDDGYLRYEPEWEAIYAYSYLDDSGSRIAMEDGQLYSAAYGYFNPGEGMEYLWYEDGGRLTEDDEPDPSGDEVPDWNGRLNGDANSYWSWDSDLCQRNVSEFEGIWYGELYRHRRQRQLEPLPACARCRERRDGLRYVLLFNGRSEHLLRRFHDVRRRVI